jgi:uncharacterized protein YlxW (UPF0749 family)
MSEQPQAGRSATDAATDATPDAAPARAPGEAEVRPGPPAPRNGERPAGDDAGTPAQGRGSTPATGTEDAGDEPSVREPPADEPASAGESGAAGEPGEPGGSGPAARRPRRRRNRLAAPLIGLLCLLLGFAFAVQVRSTDTGAQTAGQREEDLVRLLDNLNNQEDRLRQQIADQRAALDQLTSSDSQSAAALQEARSRADAIGILNGTVAAQGPGLRMTIRDPGDAVRVADLLDVLEELRGAGAETMQIDGIRVGVSTAVTGGSGALKLDGRALKAPYDVLVIGSPQDMETAMNIPGGVVQRITGQGGSVDIVQEQQVVVDALRPLDQPQYASPKSGG